MMLNDRPLTEAEQAMFNETLLGKTEDLQRAVEDLYRTALATRRGRALMAAVRVWIGVRK